MMRSPEEIWSVIRHLQAVKPIALELDDDVTMSALILGEHALLWVLGEQNSFDELVASLDRVAVVHAAAEGPSR